MKVVPGRTGQFDVSVNGERVASRGGNRATQILFGAGFPDPEDVLRDIEQRLL